MNQSNSKKNKLHQFCVTAFITLIAQSAFGQSNVLGSRWDGDNITLQYKIEPLYPDALIIQTRKFEKWCDGLGVKSKSSPKTDEEIIATFTIKRTIYLAGSKKTVKEESGGKLFPNEENTCNFVDTRPESRVYLTDIFLDEGRTMTITTKGKTRTEISTVDPSYKRKARARRMKEAAESVDHKNRGMEKSIISFKSVKSNSCGLTRYSKDICYLTSQTEHIPTKTPLFVERITFRENSVGTCTDKNSLLEAPQLMSCAIAIRETLENISYEMLMPQGIFEMPAEARKGEIKR